MSAIKNIGAICHRFGRTTGTGQADSTGPGDRLERSRRPLAQSGIGSQIDRATRARELRIVTTVERLTASIRGQREVRLHC